MTGEPTCAGYVPDEIARRVAARTAAWDPDLHPRDEGGRWSETEGGDRHGRGDAKAGRPPGTITKRGVVVGDGTVAKIGDPVSYRYETGLSVDRFVTTGYGKVVSRSEVAGVGVEREDGTRAFYRPEDVFTGAAEQRADYQAGKLDSFLTGGGKVLETMAELGIFARDAGGGDPGLELGKGDLGDLAKAFGAATAATAVWDPDLHPRDEHGRFGEKGGAEPYPGLTRDQLDAFAKLGIDPPAAPAAERGDPAQAGAAVAEIATSRTWGETTEKWGRTYGEAAAHLGTALDDTVRELNAAGYDGARISSAVQGWSQAWGIDQWRTVAGAERPLAFGESREDRVPVDPDTRRGIEEGLEVARATEHPETLYRSISLGEYSGQLTPEELTVGTVIDNRGVSSWTRDPEVANVFGRLGSTSRATLEVQGAHGLDIAVLGAMEFAWQQEVMAVDPAYRITHVESRTVPGAFDHDGHPVTQMHVVVEPVDPAGLPAAAAMSPTDLSEAVFGLTFAQEAEIRGLGTGTG